MSSGSSSSSSRNSRSSSNGSTSDQIVKRVSSIHILHNIFTRLYISAALLFSLCQSRRFQERMGGHRKLDTRVPSLLVAAPARPLADPAPSHRQVAAGGQQQPASEAAVPTSSRYADSSSLCQAISLQLIDRISPHATCSSKRLQRQACSSQPRRFPLAVGSCELAACSSPRAPCSPQLGVNISQLELHLVAHLASLLLAVPTCSPAYRSPANRPGGGWLPAAAAQ